MVHVETDDLISIGNASKLGISALVREAEEGRDRIVLRNNRPVAAVVGIERMERWQQADDDLLDISRVAARMAATGPERTSLDDVLHQFGYARDRLRNLPE